MHKNTKIFFNYQTFCLLFVCNFEIVKQCFVLVLGSKAGIRQESIDIRSLLVYRQVYSSISPTKMPLFADTGKFVANFLSLPGLL